MNIAMMVRGYIPVPGPADLIYAPIDLAIDIAEGLVRRGHNVDFYAPVGSQLKKVPIKTCGLPPLAANHDEFRDLITDTDKMVHGVHALWDSYMAECMFRQAAAGKYDLLHFHHLESALPLAKIHKKVPVIYTIHDPLDNWYKDAFELFRTDNQHFISISDNQRRDAPDLPYLRTVHNGVNLKKYPFNPKAEDYLMYVGRIVPDKGVREAVQVARETHHRLLIIGPVIVPDTVPYFDRYIKPYLDDQILYLGYMEKDKIATYYQKAKALLTPVQWEEPFGMTTIEAMASGTPVISFRRGAAPEIIVNGKTGFVVDTTAEMVEAVHKLKRIKRIDCREHVAKNFSIKNMVDGYEDAFYDVVEEQNILSTHFVKTRLRQVPLAFREVSRKRALKKVIKGSRRLK